VDLRDDRVEGGCELLVDEPRLVAFDRVDVVAVAGEQRFQLVGRYARGDGRVGDLVAVEVQDRQHRAVGDRVEELVGVPRPPSGPVSDSPSPITQATISSGLSNAAP
jgi:hypothetical protein